MKLAVDCIIAQGFTDFKLPWKYVLVKRNFDPHKGSWALPGGLVEEKDTIRETVIAETKQETGLDIKNDWFDLVGYVDNPDRDPRGRIISMVAYIKLPMIRPSDDLLKLKGDHEVQELDWFLGSDILNMNLAFDHKEIIKDYA